MDIISLLFLTLILGSLTALFGCFVLWNKLVFFGDVLSHSILPAAVIGIVLSFNMNLVMFATGTIMVGFLYYFRITQVKNINDTWLALMSVNMIALGIVVSHFFQVEIDLHDLFLGNLKLVNSSYVKYLTMFALPAIAFFLWLRHRIIMLSLDYSMSVAQNKNNRILYFVLMMLLVMFISLVVPIFGSIMTSVLLIFPPIIAYNFSKNLYGMILASIMITILTQFFGMTISFNLIQLDSIQNLPVGVAICFFLLPTFLISYCYKKYYYVSLNKNK